MAALVGSLLVPAEDLVVHAAPAPGDGRASSGDPAGATPANDAVGVLVRLERQHRSADTLDAGDLADIVRQSAKTSALPAQRVPGVASAKSLGEGFFTVELTDRVTSEQALRLVADIEASTPGAVAEPNWVIQRDPIASQALRTNAGQVNAPWGLDRTDQLGLPLDGQYAFGANGGAGVRVYIVDSGIRATHVDLAGRVASGFTAISDGRGTDDCAGHGTHVAGTVAGTSSGIAKKATVVPVRVFVCTGETTSFQVLQGLDWILSQAMSDEAPAVVNMSLGGPVSESLNAMVAELVAAGVPVVVSSGNDAVDACNYSPASAPSAITVNASGRDDVYAEFSNYGSCTDIYAPGEDIVSAGVASNDEFTTKSGTSMAAPHVAGAVAVLLSEGASPYSDFEQILASANPDVIDTGGVPDDPTALLYLAPRLSQVTSAPRNVAVSPRLNSAALTWTVPGDLNGGTIADYVVKYRAGSTGAWLTFNDGVGVTTAATVTGLNRGTSYQFSVAAKTPAGTSTPAVVQASTQSGLASVPKSVAADGGAWRVDLSWSAPSTSNGGTISDYVVRYRVGSSGSWQTFADGVRTSRSATVTGLTEGWRYEFSIAGVTQYGVGAASSPVSAIPCCTDVSRERSFATEIRWLADRGITGGFRDGTFRPLDSVNRDAMAAFLYRFAGSPAFTPPARSPFSDVSPAAPFYKEITWLASTGITGGYSDGTFRPASPVNRDAMATFLYRFAGQPSYSAPARSPFDDVTPKTPFYKQIMWLASTGVSGGYSDGTFRPLRPVARDAMAAFLYRFDRTGY